MRLSVAERAPEGFREVLALEQYLAKSLDRELLELVKLRASQINGCSFCVDMHATDLERHGVPTRKIYGVSAWREADFYSERERAALALAEQVTLIADGVDDAVWDGAAAHFSERELSDLLLAIATINVWNRIAITTEQAPPPLDGTS